MTSKTRIETTSITLKAVGFLVLALAFAPSLSAQAQASVTATATVVTVPQVQLTPGVTGTSVTDSAATVWETSGRTVVTANGLVQARVIRLRPVTDHPDRPLLVTVEYSAN